MLGEVINFKKIGASIKRGISRPSKFKGSSPAELSAFVTQKTAPTGTEATTKSERGRLRIFLKRLGMDDTTIRKTRIKDPSGQVFERKHVESTAAAYIRSATEGRTGSIKNMTRAEMNKMFNDISTYISRDLMGNVYGGGDIRQFRATEASAPIAKHFTSAEILLQKKNMGDLIEVPTAAKRATDEYANSAMNSFISALDIMKLDAKRSPITKRLKGEALRIRIGEILEIGDKQELAKIFKQLTPNQRSAMQWMRKITVGTLARQNEVRRHLGKPEIKSIEGYLHHQTIKYQNPNVFNYGIAETGKPEQRAGIGKATIKTAEQRISDLPYNKDVLTSFRAMTSMDAKDIFLNRSLEIMK